MTDTRIIVVLCSLFVLSLMAAEFLRPEPIDRSWVSTYLTGPDSWIEDVGFLLLAAAVFLMPAVLPGPRWLYMVSGISIVMVMASRVLLSRITSFPPDIVTRVHVAFSGIAFLSTGVLAFLALGRPALLVLGIMGLACALALVFAPPDVRMQIAEKLLTLGIPLAFIVQLIQRIL